MSDHNPEECITCKTAVLHKAKAAIARKNYQNDMKEPGTYAVDMQKVIILPKLTTKEHIFTSRLVCFNETFCASTGGTTDYTVLWHEGINGRKASDVTSAFVKFFVESQEKIQFYGPTTVLVKIKIGQFIQRLFRL